MEQLTTKSEVIARIIDNYIDKFGSGILDTGTRFIIALLLLIIGFRCIKYVIQACDKVFDKSKMDPTLKGFILSSLKIAIKILLIFWAINILGIAGSSIIAVLGSVGVALALSLQGSLSNIAGGIILLFMKPFKVGDYIMEGSSGKEGNVEAIGIMYTKLRTVDNRMIMVPNGNLSSSTIVNVSAQGIRQEDITVGVRYGENIKLAKEILKQIVDDENRVLPDHPVEIFVNALLDSSVEMRVRYWVDAGDYWHCRWDMLETILERFEEQDIVIPFNQLDVNLVKE